MALVKNTPMLSYTIIIIV